MSVCPHGRKTTQKAAGATTIMKPLSIATRLVWICSGPKKTTADALDQRRVWKTFNDEGVELKTTKDFLAPNERQVASMLDRGDQSTKRVASALREGELSFGYANLDDTVSARYLSNEISLNQNTPYRWKGNDGLNNAAISSAHEGQHYLDDISDASRNKTHKEARALIREEKFAESIGRKNDSLLQQTMEKLSRDGKKASRSEAWQEIKQQYIDAYGLDPKKY